MRRGVAPHRALQRAGYLFEVEAGGGAAEVPGPRRKELLLRPRLSLRVTHARTHARTHTHAPMDARARSSLSLKSATARTHESPTTGTDARRAHTCSCAYAAPCANRRGVWRVLRPCAGADTVPQTAYRALTALRRPIRRRRRRHRHRGAGGGGRPKVRSWPPARVPTGWCAGSTQAGARGRGPARHLHGEELADVGAAVAGVDGAQVRRRPPRRGGRHHHPGGVLDLAPNPHIQYKTVQNQRRRSKSKFII